MNSMSNHDSQATGSDGLSTPFAWPAPSGPAASPPRGEPGAATSSRWRRAAAGAGFLAVAGIAGAAAYGVFHVDTAHGSQQGTTIQSGSDSDSDGTGDGASDSTGDAVRGDRDGDDAGQATGDRGRVGQAPAGGGPQAGQPGTGSQSTSGSS